MKMLLILYAGDDPRLVPEALRACGHCPWTEFTGGIGQGHHHRHDGSRVFPGMTTMFVSVLPEAEARRVSAVLRDKVRGLASPDRLHVAILPVEQFA